MIKTTYKLAIGLTLSVYAHAALAETTLTFADWQVPAASTTREAAKVFMDKATELSGGEIAFDYFPAEQLGKGGEMLRLLQTGVADVSHVSPAYITDKFPLTTVAELPGMPLDSCALANGIYEMAQPGGALYEAEFEPNGIRLLFAGNLGPYSILTTETPIATLADIEGLNIRTAGGPMEMTATELGANAIRMTGSETLPSLSRGTLDGLLWPVPLVEDWGLEEALNNVTPNLSTGSFVVTYSISDSTWDRLSETEQVALLEAGKYATEHYCGFVNQTWAESLEQLETVHGIQPLDLPASELSKAEERFEQVHEQWVEGLAGRPVSSQVVYDQFREIANR
ncbi:TRAP transporter substrate-binding protein DctP [Celeribacter sp.]|uniref:TRAP transporter substrate-binding protein DctP n=1 Tax=Celeribacter sp. TaxID=1890673 RepID=UPI003A9144EF